MRNRFSLRSQQLIRNSREEALRLGNDFIDIEHILLGLIKLGDGIGWHCLLKYNVEPGELRRDLEDIVLLDSTEGSINRSTPFTKRAERIITRSYVEAKEWLTEDNLIIGTEHFVLAMLCEEDSSVHKILESHGITYEKYKQEVKKELLRLLYYPPIKQDNIEPMISSDSSIDDQIGLARFNEFEIKDPPTDVETTGLFSSKVWGEVLDAVRPQEISLQLSDTLMGRLPFIILISVLSACIFACLSLYVGLIHSHHTLDFAEVMYSFIGKSTDGHRIELGPYFWAMHTTFLPVLGIMMVIGICWIGKAMLIPVEWFCRKAGKHSNPLYLTSGLMAILAAIFYIFFNVADSAYDFVKEREDKQTLLTTPIHSPGCTDALRTFQER